MLSSLSESPNQSLEPMAISVTHPACAGCAPALAMAHHYTLGIPSRSTVDIKCKLLAYIALMLPYGVVNAAGSTQEVKGKNAIEGAWELVSAKWPDGRFPEDFSRGLIKIYSSHDFVFVGRTSRGNKVQERYGGGKFELSGSDYSESVSFHCVPDLLGQTIHFKLVIAGDRLTISGPVVSPGEKDPGFRLEEVYKRKS